MVKKELGPAKPLVRLIISAVPMLTNNRKSLSCIGEKAGGVESSGVWITKLGLVLELRKNIVDLHSPAYTYLQGSQKPFACCWNFTEHLYAH